MLHKFLRLIFQLFEGFISRSGSVSGISGYQCSDVSLHIRIFRDLGRDRDDESRHLVSGIDNHIPQFVGNIYLLTLIMVKLRTDRLEKILLNLPYSPCGHRLGIALLQLENHVFGLRALQ